MVVAARSILAGSCRPVYLCCARAPSSLVLQVVHQSCPCPSVKRVLSCSSKGPCVAVHRRIPPRTLGLCASLAPVCPLLPDTCQPLTISDRLVAGLGAGGARGGGRRTAAARYRPGRLTSPLDTPSLMTATGISLTTWSARSVSAPDRCLVAKDRGGATHDRAFAAPRALVSYESRNQYEPNHGPPTHGTAADVPKSGQRRAVAGSPTRGQRRVTPLPPRQ